MRALVILHPGFEEIEAVTPMDLLSRAGVDIIAASTGSQRTVTGRSGITIEADVLLTKEVSLEVYDAVLLPGGPGIKALRGHPLVCDLLRRQAASGRWVACICAAPLLLYDAGLLKNHSRYTCHPSAEEELPGNAEKAPSVIEGNILTSQGAGTAADFAFALIDKLFGLSTAEDIAASICSPSGVAAGSVKS